MASVNDYLKKLLYQYDCVVVPELGAFLTHYQPASYLEASGLYLPPRKRVAFNEALRLDDGILANYIMLHEPFTREGAQRHISLFVDGLRQQVQQTGHFEIDGIGSFTRNDEGRLQFDPSLRHNFYGEAYGMNAIPARSLVEEPAEAVVSPILAPAPADETTLMPLPQSRPYWRVAAAALLIGSLGLVSYFSVVKPDQPFQSSLSPANLLPHPSAFFPTPAKAPVRETPDVVVRPTPAPKVATPEATAPVTVAPVKTPAPERVAASAVSTPAPTSDVAITPAPERTLAARSAAAPLHFTIIAGSFSNKWNAQRLKKRLRKAGYKDAYVIAPATKGQLYKVAATGSDVREDVVERMGAINAVTGSDSWILKQ